ncbi:MAG: UDP-N-acetylmuramoyl-L-alanine--D-glutamate ligase [Chlamydiota bacterium]
MKIARKYQGIKTVVIGCGVSGKAAARFVRSRGSVVEIIDRRKINDDEFTVKSDQYSLDSLKPERVILSSGVSKDHPLAVTARNRGIEVVGEAEMALGDIPNIKVAITGTNGKTTVTMLVAHILKAAGKDAYPLGNVGIPLADFASCPKPGIAVVELSSFQLEVLEQVHFDAGVLLNISPDHLDRYPSWYDYVLTKCSLASFIKKKNAFFVENRVAEKFPHLLPEGYRTFGFDEHASITYDGTAIRSQKSILPVNDGNKINLANIMAAYGLCKELGVDDSHFLQGLETFIRPPHRMEFVRKYRGKTFINDSKGTNIAAVAKAVEVLQKNIILIAGGQDKDSPFEEWREVFKGKVNKVIAIGQAAFKIKGCLEPDIKVVIAEDLEEAVRVSASQEQEGEYVLLSPGCASFDMFRDYIHRGQEYKKIVGEL